MSGHYYHTTNGSGDGYALLATNPVAVTKVYVTNLTASTRFLHLFDFASLTSLQANAIPFFSLQIPPNSQQAACFDAGDFLFTSAGLAFASSTTAPEYTAGGSTDLVLSLWYSDLSH